MEGYEVITADNHKAGHVVGTQGDNLIVEQGHLRKSKHAVPKAFARADDEHEVVRLTVTSDVLAHSPKLDGDTVDTDAVAEHFGLAGGFAPVDSPQEFGDNDIPAAAAEGDHPASEERARIQTGEETGPDDPAIRERSANANDPGGVTANL